MATPFTRTLRSIRSDGFRSAGAWTLVALALLALWSAWFLRARVDVVETCSDARIAVRASLHPIEAPVDGKVARARLELGAAVRAGDLLVELDSAELALAADEERARIAAARAELAALTEQRERERLAAVEAAAVSVATREEERLRRVEHELALALAREEVARLELLVGDGIVSELDLVRARSLVQSRATALELHDASQVRREREDLRAEAERGARVAGLERELERQRGLVAAGEARLVRLAHDLAERRVLAPCDGTIAELRELPPGVAVRTGERLAALVASGELVVVADFPPSAALGRIALGQRGELRLDGFPWSRHGTLGVRVARVGGEPRDGAVQVEFELDSAQSSIPLQHGLPGVVEVVVERVSPAELVLRSAGLALARVAGGSGRESAR